MSVLLPTDDLALYDETLGDEHGWVEPADGAALWEGRGSLQLAPGTTGVDAAGTGGAGPFAPLSVQSGAVYLPPDAPARDGLVLTARGARFVLSSTRATPDPVGGGADCIVATATAISGWPT